MHKFGLFLFSVFVKFKWMTFAQHRMAYSFHTWLNALLAMCRCTLLTECNPFSFSLSLSFCQMIFILFSLAFSIFLFFIHSSAAIIINMNYEVVAATQWMKAPADSRGMVFIQFTVYFQFFHTIYGRQLTNLQFHLCIKFHLRMPQTHRSVFYRIVQTPTWTQVQLFLCMFTFSICCNDVSEANIEHREHVCSANAFSYWNRNEINDNYRKSHCIRLRFTFTKSNDVAHCWSEGVCWLLALPIAFNWVAVIRRMPFAPLPLHHIVQLCNKVHLVAAAASSTFARLQSHISIDRFN